MKSLLAGLLTVALGLSALPSHAAEVEQVPAVIPADRYFVIVFGSESRPKKARYTHTWATIVKTSPAPNDPNSYLLESQTISWMPRSLVIRPMALRGECGVNLSLEATIRDCFCKGECVAMWGPFEFDPALAPAVYERVRCQIARLNSGHVQYKCIDPDTGPKASYMSNCIHAVTDLDRHLSRPSYNELQNFGLDASRFLLGVLVSRHRFDAKVTHPWVADALGIDPRVQRARY